MAEAPQAQARARSLAVAALMSSLFLGTGAALPFLPRWLEVERGLSGLQIGAVLAASNLLRILVGTLLGAWADGFRDRRTPLRVLAVCALAFYGLFARSEGFWALLGCYFLAASAAAALVPLTEGAALRADAQGGWPYGLVRAMGSSAFIAANLLAGAHIAWAGPGVAIWWLIGAIALTSGVALAPGPPDPAPAAPLGLTARLRAGARLLRRRRLLLALLGAGLIQAAHGFYYGFSTLIWREQGLSAGLIGALWAFGTGVEVVFLLLLRRVERRVSPELLIALGGGAAALRWAALAFSPPAALLWPLQALHALTFAACHVGALRIVYQESPEEAAGFAGALYSGTAGGLFIGLAMLGSGALFDAAGAAGYLAMAGLALAGLGFTARLWRLRAPPPARAPMPPHR